jgi:hypothetical protein
MPIQYTQTVGKKGYSLITGVVENNSSIKNAVITFSDGQIRQVPVDQGQFWFFGKTGTSETDAYSKAVIGVTTQGNIISNKSF